MPRRQATPVKFLEPQEYQPRLNRLFEVVALEVRRQLPYARVEHIGASSIPGAVSKGDLDVFVGVSRCRFLESISSLEEVGFSEKAGTLRTESLCMFETQRYACDVAIQLVENSSRFEMFLHFRDLLRADPVLLDEYNAMKRACEGLDEGAYRAVKSELIERMLLAC